MRALLQRVTNASVTVDGAIIGQIDAGLLIFVCAMPDDTEATAQALAAKIAKLRLFKDDASKMNLSLAQTEGRPTRSTNTSSPVSKRSMSRPRPDNSARTCPWP